MTAAQKRKVDAAIDKNPAGVELFLEMVYAAYGPSNTDYVNDDDKESEAA